MRTIRSFLARLRKHSLKLSPSKATIDTTYSVFLGHTITPDGVRPNSNKVDILTAMPMPDTSVKQLTYLLGGLSCCRSFLQNLDKRVKPITASQERDSVQLHQ